MLHWGGMSFVLMKSVYKRKAAGLEGMRALCPTLGSDLPEATVVLSALFQRNFV